LKKAGIIGLLTAIMVLATASTAVACHIDIKPWSDPNAVNLNSNGVIPVAILTYGGYDATKTDTSSIMFAGASPVRWTYEDANGDGTIDLICFFKKQDLNIPDPDGDGWASATLTCHYDASKYGEYYFEASDLVKLVGQ
jgi:hypothetical protein